MKRAVPLGIVMAGHSASKTRVNALMSRPSTSCLLQQNKKDVDARDISAFTRVFDALCAGMTAEMS